MARGEISSGQVERMAAGGAGIVRLGGKCVFIDLAAPGDEISFRIVKDHKNWAEGELVEIHRPSGLRTRPLCPYYGRCGGCSFQHIEYEAQLDIKAEILRDAFTRIGKIDPPQISIKRSEPYGYRNRVQFHQNTEGPGFMERKSSRLVVIKDCPVAETGIRKALSGPGFPTAFPAGKKRFTVYSRLDTFLCEGAASRGRVSILDRELSIDAGIFFQSNAVMLEALVLDLMEASSRADRNLPLADAYCGVGTFAAFLGDGFRGKSSFRAIDLVEQNRAALDLATLNMPQGKTVNYYALDDTNWVKNYGDNSYGFMVLDPPREGLSGPFREWLVKKGPPMAAYVSCDPATLARDSRVLMENGYKIEELTLYDFYPQTAHIECLALFCR